MISKRNRLDRYLCKRLNRPQKDIRLLLAKGLVWVDASVCRDGGRMIDEFTKVVCDGQTLQQRTELYIALHKPDGVVCATVDAQHTTVLDLIDHPEKHSLHLVGRLDLHSTGLVLLTNNGRWSRALTSPETKVEKAYRVSVEKPITDAYAPAFAAGMYFAYEGITTAPVQFTQVSDCCAELVLTEGKYHQIKRMFGRFRNPVLSLHRHRIGSLTLDDSLGEGQWRALTDVEVQSLADLARV